MQYRGEMTRAGLRATGKGRRLLWISSCNCCAWSSLSPPAPCAAHSFFARLSRSEREAVSIAALKCPANRLGPSRTEVDARVVIHVPRCWGRGTRHGDIVAESGALDLTTIRCCGIT